MRIAPPAVNHRSVAAVLKITKVAESRTEAGILFQVAGARLRLSVCMEVRGGVRPVQIGSSARAQCSMVDANAAHTVTRKVNRCASVDGSECNGPELEADTLADQQPVQLTPQVSGTGTTWSLS